MKHTLLKIGLSETKRKDIKATYIKYAEWMNLNNNKKISINQIFKDWIELGVYKEEKKEEININREIGLIRKLGFGIIKKEGEEYYIKASEVATNINTESNIKLWGMEHVDFFYFQLLIKQRYNSNTTSELKSIYDYLKTNNYKLDEYILLSLEYKNYIKETVVNANYENILKLVRYKSGSKNQEKDNLRNKIIELYIELQITKDVRIKQSIIYLIKSWSWNSFSEGLSIFIFGANITPNFFYNNEIDIDILNENDFIKRIESKIILGVKSSYLFLIKSHLNSLNILFEFNSENVLVIDDIQKSRIESILDHNKVNELNLEKYYTVQEFINFFGINNYYNDIQEEIKIMERYYSKDKLIGILNDLKILYKEGKDNMNYINKYIGELEHINGCCDKNTFFEFIVGLCFLDKSGKITNEEVRKSLNTKLDTLMAPIRFAPGGQSDIIILYKETIINIEPTTQLYRQSKMELDSARDHLRSSMKNNSIYNYGYSIIVAPRISSDLWNDIKGFNEENTNKMSIKLFDIDSLIDMLNSSQEIYIK